MLAYLLNLLRSARLAVVGPRSVAAIDANVNSIIRELRANAQINAEAHRDLMARALAHRSEADTATRRANRWAELVA